MVTIKAQDKEAKLEAYFESNPLPSEFPVEPAVALNAFDIVAETFDAESAMFNLVPELDWKSHVEAWRAAAGTAKNARQLAAALGCLLEPLPDAHISISVESGWVPVHSADWWLNASYKGLQTQLGELRKPAARVQFTRTKEALGHVLVDGLNGGGNELPGREVAGRSSKHRRSTSRTAIVTVPSTRTWGSGTNAPSRPVVRSATPRPCWCCRVRVR